MSELRLPPAVMKVMLGLELGRQRVAAAATQQTAAEVLRCTQQKIAHIESGSGIRPLEADALMDLYGAKDSDREYVLDLLRGANRRTKRNAFSTQFIPSMRLFIEMEATCKTYCSYRDQVIPGLLQTEDYMRTLYRVWRPSPSAEQVARDVEARLARQRVLADSAQTFQFVLDEAALRRTAGTLLEMRVQLEHLVELADRPNVELQVVPFDAGYYTGHSHNFTMFGYQERTAVNIVFLEHYKNNEYLHDPKRTAEYSELWGHLRAAANGPEQSRRLLLRLRDAL
ncbi:DUF5753 domain-containing protein [Pseudonocardia spinosispora]|uniref:DUF5753 domain-containing protein n=1 Tax=Pseudonocardia spinosispora TaxID=103441 RepID=UPI0003F95806|nr:DUF5753 domain-containing protein [Pseudonocardia spinosispora]